MYWIKRIVILIAFASLFSLGCICGGAGNQQRGAGAKKAKGNDQEAVAEEVRKKNQDDLAEFLAKHPAPDEIKGFGDAKRLVYRKARIDVVFFQRGGKGWRLDHFEDEATPDLDTITQEEAFRRLGFK